MSNRPRRQYALSSLRVVVQLAAHDNFLSDADRGNVAGSKNITGNSYYFLDEKHDLVFRA